MEEKYTSLEAERDAYKKDLEDLKIEKNNLEEKYNSMKKEKEKYLRLYYEQGNLNSMSMIYIIFIFLSFITFVIYISVKACKSLQTKPKKKKIFEKLISNEIKNNLNAI